MDDAKLSSKSFNVGEWFFDDFLTVKVFENPSKSLNLRAKNHQVLRFFLKNKTFWHDLTFFLFFQAKHESSIRLFLIAFEERHVNKIRPMRFASQISKHFKCSSADKFAQAEKKYDAFLLLLPVCQNYCLLLPKSIEKCTFFYESLRKYVKSRKFERCYQHQMLCHFLLAPGSNQWKKARKSCLLQLLIMWCTRCIGVHTQDAT